ncbi:hypothetical protein [Natrinema salaciae]|uniref:Uncharacterized protein n=1 Tax=Natrinema salaciae TaxID=1186196 RepID=A0A1H9MPE3_9EURY|nr:hypothetical protein [Natrinema salaciae]SER25566.1 hypothetical protein SAMN04489841_3444 [Natrinema salaciae]
MSVVLGILLVVSLAIPLLLWLAISQETADPTVVDRAEAERIAKAHGGRNRSRSTDGPDRAAASDDHAAVGRRNRREDTDRDDEWGDRRA